MTRATFGARINKKVKKHQIKPADLIEILAFIVQIPSEEQRKEKKRKSSFYLLVNITQVLLFFV